MDLSAHGWDEKSFGLKAHACQGGGSGLVMSHELLGERALRD